MQSSRALASVIKNVLTKSPLAVCKLLHDVLQEHGARLQMLYAAVASGTCCMPASTAGALETLWDQVGLLGAVQMVIVPVHNRGVDKESSNRLTIMGSDRTTVQQHFNSLAVWGSCHDRLQECQEEGGWKPLLAP